MQDGQDRFPPRPSGEGYFDDPAFDPSPAITPPNQPEHDWWFGTDAPDSAPDTGAASLNPPPVAAMSGVTDPLPPDEVVPPKKKRKKWVAVLLWIIMLALMLGGALLIWIGLTKEVPPENAPLPEETFAYSKDDLAEPAEPAAAEVPDSGELVANRLVIPSLGINAPIDEVGIGSNGLDVPRNSRRVGHYQYGGQVCGTQGTVLIAGHVVYNGTIGALYSLYQIKPNAVVYITCNDGTVTRWRTVEVAINDKEELPNDLYYSTGEHRAVLVTCGGRVNSNGTHKDNIRVYLTPFPEPTPEPTEATEPTAAPSEGVTGPTEAASTAASDSP